MGASDAINALRSEAVSKTTLSNVVSDMVGQINADAQKQAGAVKAARDNAAQALSTQNSSYDSSWSRIRSSLKSLNESAIGLVFGLINTAMGYGGSAIAAAADLVSMVVDIRSMAEEIKTRDRHWDAAQQVGTYVQMYSPSMPALKR